jgi:type III secretory pathway component EscS
MRQSLWMQAFGQAAVWRRAAVVGLPIGVLQAVINQGDVWLRHEATVGTVIKTLISPLVTFSVALISAASVWVDEQRRSSEPPPQP